VGWRRWILYYLTKTHSGVKKMNTLLFNYNIYTNGWSLGWHSNLESSRTQSSTDIHLDMTCNLVSEVTRRGCSVSDKAPEDLILKPLLYFRRTFSLNLNFKLILPCSCWAEKLVTYHGNQLQHTAVSFNIQM
jgi:hypothetical protein